MSHDQTNPPSVARPPIWGGVLKGVLDLFSSVRLGIVLMALLLVYASIGSAGIIYPVQGAGDFRFLGLWFRHDMPRQWRWLELTEFEWFHTPAFNALVLLICANIIITTLRRIRFSVVNLGVWMIHTGIITLAIGSFIYFGKKVEGDAPVLRAALSIAVPGAPAARLPVLPGAGTQVTTSQGDYRVSVQSIDPQWELRTTGEEGKSAFAVSVSVQTPKTSFVRQVLAGYPEFTEDVIPGRGRVKKLPEFEGRALVDDSVQITLEPPAQASYWVKDSAALYVRTQEDQGGHGTNPWSQRPIAGLPRYNDYVSSVADDLWPVQSDERGNVLRPHPLSVAVPPASGATDPLSGADVRITGFLRYAVMQEGFVEGGTALNPMVELTLGGPDGTTRNMRLLSADPARSRTRDGRIVFDWATSQEDLDALLAHAPTRLTLALAGTDVSREIQVPARALADPETRPLEPLGDTGWSFRVRELVRRLPLASGETVSLVLLELQTPEGTRLTRWVFEDPARNRDNPLTAENEPARVVEPDRRLTTTLELGSEQPDVRIVAGPAPIGVRVYGDQGASSLVASDPAPDARLDLGQGRSVIVRRVVERARALTKPLVIPWQQREKAADSVQAYTLVRVEVSVGGRRDSQWIPFHRYVMDDPGEASPTLTVFQPAVFTLENGRRVEVIVGRERRPLPTPVILDDFILTSTVGGFTGETNSVRDWTSVLRFEGPTGQWTDSMRVSTNSPVAHAGFWYFQAFWDAPRSSPQNPDLASAGMAFTGLGVGNREGVYTQLAGSCLSVAGMLYAFYVKPIIKRRRRERVLAGLAADRASATAQIQGRSEEAHPVGAGAPSHATQRSAP